MPKRDLHHQMKAALNNYWDTLNWHSDSNSESDDEVLPEPEFSDGSASPSPPSSQEDEESRARGQPAEEDEPASRLSNSSPFARKEEETEASLLREQQEFLAQGGEAGHSDSEFNNDFRDSKSRAQDCMTHTRNAQARQDKQAHAQMVQALIYFPRRVAANRNLLKQIRQGKRCIVDMNHRNTAAAPPSRARKQANFNATVRAELDFFYTGLKNRDDWSEDELDTVHVRQSPLKQATTSRVNTPESIKSPTDSQQGRDIEIQSPPTPADSALASENVSPHKASDSSKSSLVFYPNINIGKRSQAATTDTPSIEA